MSYKPSTYEILFETPFLIYVPRLATFTDYNNTVGGYSINTDEEDNTVDNANEMTRVMWKVIWDGQRDILTAFENGFTVTMPNLDDILLIYNALEEHIKLAEKDIGRTINQSPIDPEDLKRMDRLAQSIYETNKEMIMESKQHIISNYGNSLFNRLKQRDDFIKTAKPEENPEREQYKPPIGVGSKYTLDDLLN